MSKKRKYVGIVMPLEIERVNADGTIKLTESCIKKLGFVKPDDPRYIKRICNIKEMK